MRWTPATRALDFSSKAFQVAKTVGSRVLPVLARAVTNPYVLAAVAAVAIVAGIAYFVYKAVNGKASEPPPPPTDEPAQVAPDVPVVELPEPFSGYPRSIEEIRRYASLLDPGEIYVHPRLRGMLNFKNKT